MSNDPTIDYLVGIYREMMLRERLDRLARNLTIAAALERAYHLGGAACWCDQGPRGNEWYPGMGCSPEAIVNRVWNDNPHDYKPSETFGPDQCEECGRDAEWYLHTQCRECYAMLYEPEFEHHDGCTQRVKP